MAGRSVPGRLLGTRHGVALAAARQQELQVAARPVQAAGRQAGRQRRSAPALLICTAWRLSGKVIRMRVRILQ